MRTRVARSLVLGLALVAGLGTPAHRAHAQDAAQPASPNLRLGIAPVTGNFTALAARAYRWQDNEGNTRLYLDGGAVGERVTLYIADYTLEARKASVWLREVGRDANGNPLVEVYATLEDVGSPTDASGGTTFSGPWLPVRAALQTTEQILVRADVTTESQPPTRDDDIKQFLTKSQDAYTKAITASKVVEPLAPRPTFTPGVAAADAAPTRWKAQPPATRPRGEAPIVSAQTDAKPAQSNRSRTWNPSSLPGATRTSEQAPASATRTPQSAPATTAAAQPATTTATTTVPREATQPTAPAQTQTQTQTQTPAQAQNQSQNQAQPPASQPAQPVAPQPATADATSTPIFARSGMITIAAGKITFVSADANDPTSEDAVIASEGLTVLYKDARTGRILQATAQRGVLFLAKTGTPATPGAMEFSAESVRGFYLEGEAAASDGSFNLRAPQLYYDVASNRGVMLDAVFWTYDAQRNLPFYVRAKEVRQTSTEQFTAKNATFTNSAFFEPELAIGARNVTITRKTREVRELFADDSVAPRLEPYNQVKAENITLRSNDVPFFWWPSYSGDPEQPFIKDVRIENRSGSGLASKVRWNALNLLNIGPVDGFSADLQTDFYVERGPALGTRLDWETRRHKGDFFAYMVPLDRGTDVLKPGTEINQDEEFRGIITGYDRFRVSDHWTVLTELSYISDATFIDAFYEEAGESRREFTNRLRGERTESNTQLTLEASGPFNDFLANEWLLQSRGYSVTKLPEVAYVRQADDLLGAGAPGLLTWSSEYRIGRYALATDEIALEDRGFNTILLADRVFGIDPALSPSDALRARGLNEDAVTRMDTRHELTAKMSDGVNVVSPFAIVRGTFYDNEFDGFSSRAGGNDELRVWSAAGARVSTSFNRVIDSVDSRFFDIHRLRHIVEPNATFWVAGTNVEANDIPTYDARVDNLADGAAVRLGVAQIFQTKRGGPGRWHDVDLLKINTDFVFASDDSDPQTPIGRFFDARPEYSALGDYFVGDMQYRLTDATSIVASTIYDFDDNQQDISTAGLLIQHSPNFTTLADVRFLNAQDSTVLTVWGDYQITDKYGVLLSPNYSMSEGEFQSVFARVTRRFSAFQASISINYDNIQGETSFGFVFQPYGATTGVGATGTGLDGVYSGGSGL
ncbi:MAG: LPS assembly protein LptD [Phycisphaerae bacterium]